MEEITFIARCELCHKADRPCRNHHLIPMRLLKRLPKNTYLRWFKKTIIVCNQCNGYIHPENHLYQRINYLEGQLGMRLTDFNNKEAENNGEIPQNRDNAKKDG
jgi:hypothetical protein